MAPVTVNGGCGGPGGCDCGRDASSDPVSDGGTQAFQSADFGRLQGHELADDLGTDTDHCIRCGFCTNACPVFAETKWESVSPRGHANVIKAYLDGDLDEPEQIEENLDLCIKCKQCVAPCPAGVEIPKLVIRANERLNEEEGSTLGDRLFADPRRLNALGSLAAPLSNLLSTIGPVRSVMESVLGIDARRPLPTFHRETFQDWYADHEPATPVGGDDLDRDVAVYVDCYVNYNAPEIGKAAVTVLERAGANVSLADPGCCGRAALSKGFVSAAETNADAALPSLADLVAEGRDVVCIEPSCAAMLKDEFLDMFDDPRAAQVADNAYELMEYLEEVFSQSPKALPMGALDEHVAVHSHCHTKHLGIDGAAAAVLSRIPDLAVDEPHVSCCGMAGSFGYQSEYYDLSMDIGENLFAQIRDSGGDPVATGFSCRSQIKDGMDDLAEHPVQVLERATRPERVPVESSTVTVTTDD